MTTKEKTIDLKFIETSDVHGSFFPYDFINRKPKAGSLARVATYVNQLRSQHGENVILLDNGDILQGQPVNYYSNYVDTTSANIAAQVVNYLRYDAQTIGNHDVETGHRVYDKWVSATHCPILGANVIDTKTNKPYLKPYTILKRGGARIAIIGLLTPAIPNWLGENLWSGLRFEEMVSSARQWMRVVKEQEKADIVIGLFHSGKDGGITTPHYKEDAALAVAREVPGFDVVFFGHDHTRYADAATNSEGKLVACLDPANNAMSVAQADLQLVKKKGRWCVKESLWKLVDVADLPVDNEFVDHFSAFNETVKAYANRVIGTFENTISTRDSYFGNSAFNDLILNLELSITKADVAFNAPVSFDVAIKKGPVRVADMFNLYKYENQLFVMRLTGKEIRKALEMSYDLWVNTMTSPNDHLLLLDSQTRGDQQRLGFKNFSFNFDSAAGIDYEVDVTKPNGQKVKVLKMSNGEPFDENKYYKVAVNSYRANGGGELLTRGAGIAKDDLDDRIVWRSEFDLRHYLMEEIKRLGTLNPQPNTNWRFVPEQWTQEAAKRDRLLLFHD
ncbi:MAG: bifunctional metallophosphatase/5'-nucleotidase [Hallella sp.]|uniref:bifunctional metallophosphatase/5'-nucleotidase n=1 Tax=Hallella sp. TaxID=2980186 RepID=UPI0025837640|nr:bifunctional metallophosphatase/5'-nucleotidase [Hallella sp.]MDD7146127.1 bifunctional metallophosphatase/5'-nucleotidase [Hallella sp.]